ncbi:MAG: hypothetical protein ACI9WU_003154 [Myxococcota bacterium]
MRNLTAIIILLVAGCAAEEPAAIPQDITVSGGDAPSLADSGQPDAAAPDLDAGLDAAEPDTKPPYDGPPCGDSLCALDESPCSCPEDCIVETCGNGVCCEDAGETTASCAKDCGIVCGDGTCAGQERTCNCPEDCGQETCGNEVCCEAAGETGPTCPQDCGTVCGDGVCDGGETPCGCLEDCGNEYCGNGYCCPAKGETNVICPKDCL